MRGYLPSYELRAPRDLHEALAMMAERPSQWRPFAGGTDLMVLFEAGKLPAGNYLSLWNLRELRGITATAATVTIGALTTYADVLHHPVLLAEFPMLCRAAAETGGVATQNRGTLGGNIANASPAADTPPTLLVYDAELELQSVRGTRRVPYDGFHTAYKKTLLAPDELIRSIVLRRGRQGWTEAYRKVGTRRAQAISKLCFAGALQMNDGIINDARIAFGSVAPTVVRCPRVEASLRGNRISAALAESAARALAGDVKPIDDVRSTAIYRMKIAQNILADFVRSTQPDDSGETL
jgi:CO/xanthine dehydrogenase FAD-binding subunit